MNILQSLRETVMILKLDEGQGILLVNKDAYIRNVVCLFSDKTKFQVLDKDPTFHFLNTVKNYLIYHSIQGKYQTRKIKVCVQSLHKQTDHMGYRKLIKGLKIYLHSNP